MSDTNTAEVTVVSPRDNNEKTWLIALIVFGVITVGSLIYLVSSLMKVTDYLSSINKLEVVSASIVKDVNDATFSRDFEVSSAAYIKLKQDVNDYESTLQRAMSMNTMGGQGVLGELSSEWQTKKSAADFVINQENGLNGLHDFQTQVVASAKEIQEQYDAAITQALSNGAPVSVIKEMQAQVLRAERIASQMNNLAVSTDGKSEDFKQAVAQFGQVLESQVASLGEAVPALATIQTIFASKIVPVSQEFETLAMPAIQARESAKTLSDIGVITQNKLAAVDRNIIAQPHIIGAAIGLLIGALGMIFSLLKLLGQRNRVELLQSSKESMHERHEREKEQAQARRIQEENERNQMAILRLLDELGDLAEGDLTVNATVSEDFTGAIADSVNFAIDQLRQLVLAINTTADRVAQSSQQTQMTAVELAEASEHQAQEIAGVSAAINEMAVSIDQVSANASESSSVAQRSVAIAHNGAEVVQRSIEGMNIIRDQIQETSKRIKRLGESSQEIGDIVGLINDIADQTNILALNAAIQASMAGEAGRGFAVVADEVQRLAERSAAATRQIETLVKTIQADTNEAVSSMESTTAEVVKGAKLAKDAGEALGEVQNVSNTLAELIQSISNAAQQQATSAGHISSTMNIIQDITSQTSSGTMATARSVGRLNEMAAALQESVSGFKLSDDDVFFTQDDGFEVK
ncbi:MAG: methyl-accepting chemotaxis protein [Moraxella sp.]|nr:methyl-accepting chemotaxis protein [Moraxella sp.]